MSDADTRPRRRIYLASSWRNEHYPEVLEALRNTGHEVYDFRNPAPQGGGGFSWSEIDPDWRQWGPHEYVRHVTSDQAAARGFAFDKAGLDWCDTLVLVLPCGRSAHLEADYAVGQGKEVVILLHEDRFEPELMYLLCRGLVTSVSALLRRLDWRLPVSLAEISSTAYSGEPARWAQDAV
jgi:hypothetical protein